MRASSRAALEQAENSLAQAHSPNSETSYNWANQWFNLSDLVQSSARLAAALTDPSRSVDDKADLLSAVAPQLSPEVKEAAKVAVATLSRQDEIASVFENLGFHAVRLGAIQDEQAIALADEIFAFEQFVRNSPDVRSALSDRNRDADNRIRLLKQLLGDKLSQPAFCLISRVIKAVNRQRNIEGVSSLTSALRHLRRDLAKAADKLVATVQVATPLQPSQAERLQNILSQRYGKDIYLQVSVLPSLIGGIKVRVGSQVFDGSLATIINKTKQKLVG